jgi:hypothetical protein
MPSIIDILGVFLSNKQKNIDQNKNTQKHTDYVSILETGFRVQTDAGQTADNSAHISDCGTRNIAEAEVQFGTERAMALRT